MRYIPLKSGANSQKFRRTEIIDPFCFSEIFSKFQRKYYFVQAKLWRNKPQFRHFFSPFCFGKFRFVEIFRWGKPQLQIVLVYCSVVSQILPPQKVQWIVTCHRSIQQLCITNFCCILQRRDLTSCYKLQHGVKSLHRKMHCEVKSLRRKLQRGRVKSRRCMMQQGTMIKRR